MTTLHLGMHVRDLRLIIDGRLDLREWGRGWGEGEQGIER